MQITKKLILALLLLIITLKVNSQIIPTQKERLIVNEKKISKFHHTIGLNLTPIMLGGYKVYDILGFSEPYKVKFGGNHYLNLLPYYEIDYNKKISLITYIRYNNISYNSDLFIYNLIFTYNFLKPQSPKFFKIGAGGTYQKTPSIGRINYVAYLSYKEMLNKHFSVGLTLDFSSYGSTTTTRYFDGMKEEKTVGGSTTFHAFVNLSYTF
ncbi:MAG: hypothetical protein PHE13_01880 [Bacteroidales bacterium]|nr:hypothetical protein [Bacteroidales bacterium]